MTIDTNDSKCKAFEKVGRHVVDDDEKQERQIVDLEVGSSSLLTRPIYKPLESFRFQGLSSCITRSVQRVKWSDDTGGRRTLASRNCGAADVGRDLTRRKIARSISSWVAQKKRDALIERGTVFLRHWRMR